MAMYSQVLSLSLFFLHVIFINGEMPFKKFEYKYSFKPPYLSQKDGTVPFWEHSGNAIASEENLRVTPSLRSQKGAIWSKLETNFDNWEVELVFRVTGRGRIGADGLAFWFTSQKGADGPVFGSTDQWKGLGVFFDSFDNDNKHNNPYIMAMLNDGTLQYDHQNDGSTQQIAGCLRDFRNKPFPVRAKISYYKNVLMIMFNNGMSNNDNDYELCMRSENIFLPSRGYFGISAATGGLADDHDVQKFMTWSLTPEQQVASDMGISNTDQQKFEKEFQEYQQQTQIKKDEYQKEHPEFKKEKDDDDWFEEEQIRELRQIFQGQSETRGMIQGIARKLDEIVGRQETTISLVTGIQQGGVAPIQGHGQIPQVPMGASPLQRHEVENILASSRELVASTREIKNYLVTISNKQDQQGGGVPANYGNFDPIMNEIREGMNIVKRDLGAVSQRVHSQPAASICPTGNCISTTLFFVVVLLQTLILIGYALWRNSKESQAKKFY